MLKISKYFENYENIGIKKKKSKSDFFVSKFEILKIFVLKNLKIWKSNF